MSLHFIKLGGSLITDKNRPLTPRPLVIQRLAAEVAAAHRALPDRRFLISHGSGSYGHVVGRKYRTRQGVRDAQGWRGFAETAHIAAQLNRLVQAALLHAGLSAISFPPSALAQCRDGEIVALRSEPIEQAWAADLLPVVYGDVAFDETWGGTIISTEQILSALALQFRPAHITLVGVVDGVFDADPLRHADARRIPHITTTQLPELRAVLGSSHGIDVTGGMGDKMQTMAQLLVQLPHVRIHLLTGELPGHLLRHLLDPDLPLGTTLTT